MREDLMKRIKEYEDFKNASIDEILRILIDESDLIEVTACLDMIATVENGTRIVAYNWTGRTYPIGEHSDITIPPPPWKLDPNAKADIKQDSGLVTLTQPSDDAENKEKEEEGDSNETSE